MDIHVYMMQMYKMMENIDISQPVVFTHKFFEIPFFINFSLYLKITLPPRVKNI